MSFADELNLVLAKSGKTQAELAEDLKVSRQAVQFWASGRSEPKGSNLAKFRELAKQWGVGDGVHYPSVIFHPDDANIIPDGYAPVKSYRWEFAAHPGDGDTCSYEWVEDEYEPPALFPYSFFKKHKTTPERCRRAWVKGDSMEPEICSGDSIIFIAEPCPYLSQVNIHDGGIYCLSVGGYLKIKRIQLIKNGIELVSENNRYSVETYTGEECEDILIYGRVIFIERSLP